MTASEELAIEVIDLHKSYGSVNAVRGINLDVRVGECVGILGPNGAGKTTAIEMIEGLRQPDRGTIRIFGQPVWPHNPDLLQRIGVQLQQPAFIDKLTTQEQLETYAALYGAERGRVDAVLELMGLTKSKDQPAERLSGGQRQRLSIGCAIVHEPDMLFLDEPSAALDPTSRRGLWAVIEEVRAMGTTVVLSTHYMEEAEELCTRVAIMDQGRVLDFDTPAEMIRQLGAPTRISLPPTVMPESEAQQIRGVDSTLLDMGSLTLVTQDPATVITELASRDILTGLQVRSATLEDVFISSTGKTLDESAEPEIDEVPA